MVNGAIKTVSQISFSENTEKFTLRGLHFLAHPYEEQKSVFVVSGKMQDVKVDMRPESEFLHQHESVILNQGEGVIIPPGFAHGFLTLEPNTQLIYVTSSPFDPTLDRGVHYADPKFSIQWAEEPSVVSARDLNHAFLR